MGELLRRFLPPYRTKALVGVVCKVVEVVFDLLTPMVVASMIDVGVGNRDMGYVMRMGGVLVVFALVGYAFTCVCQRLAANVSQGMGTAIRSTLYAHIMELDTPEVDRFGTPSLITRLTGDVNNVQVAVAMGVRMLVRWPFIAVGSIVAALLIDVRLGVVFLVCTPAIALVFAFVMMRSVPLYGAIQTKLDTLARLVRESLEGVRVIRAFGRESFETKRFDVAADDQADTSIAVGKLSASLNPATFIIMNLGVVAILWSGSFRIDAGSLTQGELVAFVNYMTQLLISIGYVANLVVIFMRGSTSATRIMEVLDTQPQIVDGPLGWGDLAKMSNDAPVAGDAGAARPVSQLVLPATPDLPALTFDHVSFSYGKGAPALHDVSFALAQGATLGIIGGTGSGKSTLAQLAVRLYDPSEGSISLGNIDITQYELAMLRIAVSMVPQKASLISGTIRDNLRWRNPAASDDELWEALTYAQAADFVREKADGLGEPVEAGGSNFSGGQRQRLTIARAFVGSPRVVVFDDSASALDYATDARLRASLKRLPAHPTIVLISQRVASVMGADQILVLDHGNMVGLGTHRELLESCPVYREICLSQLRPEEVGV